MNDKNKPNSRIVIDWNTAGITIERSTQRYSLSGVIIDRYIFRRGDKEWGIGIQRKSRVAKFNLSLGETLSQALKSFEDEHNLDIINKPGRIKKEKKT